jgi:hypothetical protein
MKFIAQILLCLFISPFVFSQNCTSFVWFKPGTQLEYSSFSAREQKDKGEFEEVAHFTFTVNNVIDSAGSPVAYITKKVQTLKKKRIFEKKLKVICKDGRIGFEMSHFLCDTIVRSYYPLDLERTFSFAGSAKGGMIYPFSAPKSMGSTQVQLVSVRSNYYNAGNRYKDPSWEASEDKYPAKSTVVKLELLGEENITCPAGTFKCFKLLLTREFDFGTRIRRQISAHLYYNKEIGIVRWEDPISYTELTGITK